ncbi:MAG: ATP-dependent protease ATPase subunit HslU [Spirochaetales bacterium]|nr:ATP-dependent protease ATPase subunit HslU [Spirochaetales bacterium]MCF7937621.1 ATP-dependent protease ATPase subunit HslU [Spirochaetales bacterium]
MSDEETKTLDGMTPREIVSELDKYIIGQEKAKKAVAIALRNRSRRRLLPEALKDEVAPKNIIMIGPTGVGKTEIARRLSKLYHAPFIKVEATKYTEVGYVGRDVEAMVRDLVSVAYNMVWQEMQKEVEEEAKERTEEALLDLLLPGGKKRDQEPQQGELPAGFQVAEREESKSETREKFRKMLREGKFDDKEVEVEISQNSGPAFEIFSGTSLEDMGINLGGFNNLFGGKKKKKRVTVNQAREILLGEEMGKLIDTDRVSEIARNRVQDSGIIFIDEIDKVAAKEGRTGGDVSREGVQRDILPIVEGSTINTKYGMVDTSHILFIAAGAFHMSKPSDLIPELQGRFPLRVELDALNAEEFKKILTQPENALTKQYVALIQTEGVTIKFTDESVEKISEIAANVNNRTENIGARRLHTILELLLEDISFDAPDLKGQEIPITAEYVEERLQDVVEDQDVSRYIL